MAYQEDIYDIVRLIPSGKVTTYGRIANFLTLGSARMVGWALNQSGRSGLNIPAHRVVNRKGELSGRLSFATPTLMQELLIQEGVEVKDDRIVDLERFIWSPEEVE